MLEKKIVFEKNWMLNEILRFWTLVKVSNEFWKYATEMAPRKISFTIIVKIVEIQSQYDIGSNWLLIRLFKNQNRL